MAGVTIDGAALTRIQKKLGTFQRFQQEAKAPMQETVELLVDALKEYPRKDPNAFSLTATPAQRRAYFAKMSDAQKKSGDWAYRRTGTLGRKWAKKNYATGGGRRGEVGNNTEYARYVQSFAQQQPFHRRSGWLHDDLAVRKNKAAILQIWTRWVRRQLTDIR